MTPPFARRVSILIAGFAVMTAVAACGSSGSGTGSSTGGSSTASGGSTPSAPAGTAAGGLSGGGSAPAATAAVAAVVTIKNFAYRVPVSVPAGAMVKVTNSDQVAHTVTADQSASVFNVTVDPGSSAMFTAPTKPGSYKFHCTYHSNMHGTLVVK